MRNAPAPPEQSGSGLAAAIDLLDIFAFFLLIVHSLPVRIIALHTCRRLSHIVLCRT